MQIVIIGGLPCSGKSKLAERLRSRLAIPLLSKDEFKELLFDSLGAHDRAWSRRLSEAAYAVMFRAAAHFADVRSTFILEGNFREHQHREHFRALAETGARFLQVHCRADPEVLVARFTDRCRAGTRHSGHADRESLPEIEREMRTATQSPLSLPGEVIVCDTTEDWGRAIDAAVDQVLRCLGEVASGEIVSSEIVK
jgi:predicted kinase